MGKSGRNNDYIFADFFEPTLKSLAFRSKPVVNRMFSLGWNSTAVVTLLLQSFYICYEVTNGNGLRLRLSTWWSSICLASVSSPSPWKCSHWISIVWLSDHRLPHDPLFNALSSPEAQPKKTIPTLPPSYDTVPAISPHIHSLYQVHHLIITLYVGFSLSLLKLPESRSVLNRYL